MILADLNDQFFHIIGTEFVWTWRIWTAYYWDKTSCKRGRNSRERKVRHLLFHFNFRQVLSHQKAFQVYYMYIFLYFILLLLTPPVIYLRKVSNRNTKTRCEICSKLTINTPERRQWCRSGVFIVNFEHISHLVLVFLLLT